MKKNVKDLTMQDLKEAIIEIKNMKFSWFEIIGMWIITIGTWKYFS